MRFAVIQGQKVSQKPITLRAAEDRLAAVTRHPRPGTPDVFAAGFSAIQWINQQKDTAFLRFSRGQGRGSNKFRTPRGGHRKNIRGRLKAVQDAQLREGCVIGRETLFRALMDVGEEIMDILTLCPQEPAKDNTARFAPTRRPARPTWIARFSTGSRTLAATHASMNPKGPI